MAGGAVGGESHGARKKKGKRKPKKRLNIRIDMTPLVDVAFLLLTFFMLTTTFRKPQTMEINLPPDDKARVEIAESNLLTLRVDENKLIYYNFGIEIPKKMKYEELKKFLVESAQQNPKLVVLLKLDRKGKFNYMVDIIDELNTSNLSRFSIAPLTEIDLKEMARAT